jgi:hypothetical protein
MLDHLPAVPDEVNNFPDNMNVDFRAPMEHTKKAKARPLP